MTVNITAHMIICPYSQCARARARVAEPNNHVKWCDVFKVTPDDVSALEIIASDPFWHKSEKLRQELTGYAREVADRLVEKARTRKRMPLKRY